MKLRRRVVIADLSRPRLGEAQAPPLASGVHVGPLRQVALGAIGLTTSPHKSESREVQPRPSDPREEGPSVSNEKPTRAEVDAAELVIAEAHDEPADGYWRSVAEAAIVAARKAQQAEVTV